MTDKALALSDSDFALFRVPQQFAQDRGLLDTRWKELQREAHPDRFASQGASAQRLAMQWSVRINEAYQRLKDPLQRAKLLCELAGVAIDAENNTAMPHDFLMQQMEWREALDDAQAVADVEALQTDMQQERATLLAACAESLDVRKDYVQAAQQVRSLMFVARFAEDVQVRLYALEDQPATTPMPGKGKAD